MNRWNNLWIDRWNGHRGENGSSLVLVLGLVTILSLLVPALLTMADTGLRITSPVVRDRAEIYAATSALEAAIAIGRGDDSIGAQGATCPSQTLQISGFEVTVECQGPALSQEGCHYFDRFATYFAEVRELGKSEVLFASSAEVAYRFDPTGAPTVEVRQFTSHASAPVTTVPVPSCHGTPPSTTTTTMPPTTSTTSTTTTTTPPSTTSSTTSTSTTTTTTSSTVPPSTIAMYVEWTDPKSEVPPTTSKNTWRAVGTVRVTNAQGQAVSEADVTVNVRYLRRSTWTDEPQSLTGRTDQNGVVRLNSKEYQSNGQPVETIEMSIVTVNRTGYTWTSLKPPLTITVKR
ncbi:MAG TPA: hypothetical protein VL068_06455 [Microthrixaceae bacterium]|nr:hypothetical protein [Microthrixaceae bacterium]